MPLSVLLGLLTLMACGGEGPDRSGQPTNSSSASSPSDRMTSGSPTGSGSPAELCDRIDPGALREATGLRLGASVQSDVRPGQVTCTLAGTTTPAGVVVLVRDEHGSLSQDADQARSLGTEQPEELMVAGRPALLVSARGSGSITAGLVTHVDGRLLLVRSQGLEGGTVTSDSIREITRTTAEMVAGG